MHEIAGQQQDVLAALAQWRYLQVQHVQAVEQVFAKGTLGDHFLQVAVGGAEDPHVDLDLTVAAHPAKAAIAEKPQQLGLQVGRHFADLVEKHRALVGQFHQPRLAATLRTCKGPGGIAEQFALGKVLRQGCTVQGQERCSVSAADGMAGAGHQLFAGTGFAMDQQRGIQGGDPQCAGLECTYRR